MRLVLPLAVAGLLAPVPALADESDTRRAAEELRDPAMQAQMATTVQAVTEALLSMPVAPIARAVAEIEGVDPDYVDPDLQAGDLVGPGTIEATEEFAERLPQMMGALATMAVAMEDMLPELRERIEQARSDSDGY